MKKRIKSNIGFGFLSAILLIVLYFAFHTVITNIIAGDYYQLIKEKSYHIVDQVLEFRIIPDSSMNNAQDENSKPAPSGYPTYTLLQIINDISETRTMKEYETPLGSLRFTNPDPALLETAAVIQDSAGNILLESGDYVLFSYYEEAAGPSAGENNNSYGYMDLNDLSEEAKDWFYQVWQKEQETDEFSSPEEPYIREMKITGTKNQDKIIPVEINVKTIENTEWENIYTAGKKADAESVTIYTKDPDICFYNQTEDLLSVLQDKSYGTFNDKRNYTSFVYHSNQFIDLNGEKYNLVYAISASPMNIAKNELKYVYNWAKIIILLIWLILNCIAYLKLVKPVLLVNKAFQNEYGYIWKEKEGKNLWREQDELIGHYLAMRNHNFKHKVETDHLKDALLNSEQAEEYSKKRAKDLAHDLKNPMSIIYTYSEALKDNISEEKNEEYYEVILSEIKHMENMVTDMLDLSREKEV